MVRVLVSGGSGLVGRSIVNHLEANGYDVTVGGRRPPPASCFIRPVGFVPLYLDPRDDSAAAFEGIDSFIHAAFSHEPGKYRGGEGDDPDGFRRLNLDGTVRLFETAKAAGVSRVVFLSSRAVYDGVPDGTVLSEKLTLAPRSLYGEVKLSAEQALADLTGSSFTAASLRATGVYSPLRPNKWDGLFADYLAGRKVPSRAGSEVHGDDLAAAVRLMLETEGATMSGRAFNVSDIVTDTHEILSPLKAATACPHPLPAPADRLTVREMPTDRLRALGWKPGGRPALIKTLAALARTHEAAL
jgi:nucleoside-diphosphate-sugar epimerase